MRTQFAYIATTVTTTRATTPVSVVGCGAACLVSVFAHIQPVYSITIQSNNGSKI